MHPTRHPRVEGRRISGAKGEGELKERSRSLLRFNFVSHCGICEEYLSAHKNEGRRGEASGKGG